MESFLKSYLHMEKQLVLDSLVDLSLFGNTFQLWKGIDG